MLRQQWEKLVELIEAWNGLPFLERDECDSVIASKQEEDEVREEGVKSLLYAGLLSKMPILSWKGLYHFLCCTVHYSLPVAFRKQDKTQ